VARSPRRLLPGAWHHATNRAPQEGVLFRDEADVASFVRLLGEMPLRLGVEIHAYCVMGTHYHLLVRATHADLEDAVDWLDVHHARRLLRTGPGASPIFRHRFGARPVGAVRHLLRASRYIHVNPVEAGLVARPGDWPYSSYRAYLDPRHEPAWLRTSVVLGSFGSVGARDLHRRFVEEGVNFDRYL
jgi:REP element-mobilizing transposase RayT